jgi:RNA 3'-terminal phosphate cyclase (ATP)
VEGAALGSQEITYWPGEELKEGEFRWDIGTAGSTTMLALTMIPLALFSKGPSYFSIIGGLFQDFAPSAFHMREVLIPFLRRMGASIKVEMLRPGYVPKGQGHLRIEVEPIRKPMAPVRLIDQGDVKIIHGISLSSHLEASKVSERMAAQCQKLLRKKDYQSRIETIHDTTAPQKGAALILWAETNTGALIGADQAGKTGRRSESIAHFVVTSLLQDIRSGATTDRHMADQLILFAALARGRTEYRIPMLTDHVKSNLWLIRKLLGAEVELQDNFLKVDGIGLHPSGR